MTANMAFRKFKKMIREGLEGFGEVDYMPDEEHVWYVHETPEGYSLKFRLAEGENTGEIGVSLIVTGKDGSIQAQFAPENYTPEFFTEDYDELENRIEEVLHGLSLWLAERAQDEYYETGVLPITDIYGE